MVVTLSYEENGRSFSSDNTVAFRNELLISNEAGTLVP
jgi:hypothetical protein